jgi:hypothetical protein
MSTQLRGIGGCNDGFLRDDALLMITMIGGWDVEGWNKASTGTPEAWAQAVVDAKNGRPDSVVMLDIGDTSFPWQDRIWKLTQMFKYGLVTDARRPRLWTGVRNGDGSRRGGLRRVRAAELAPDNYPAIYATAGKLSAPMPPP